MGFMMGEGIMILAEVEINYKIFREIAIPLSSSIERQIGNSSFVGRRPIIFISVSSATGLCSVYSTVSNLIKYYHTYCACNMFILSGGYVNFKKEHREQTILRVYSYNHLLQ